MEYDNILQDHADLSDLLVKVRNDWMDLIRHLYELELTEEGQKIFPKLVEAHLRRLEESSSVLSGLIYKASQKNLDESTIIAYSLWA